MKKINKLNKPTLRQSLVERLEKYGRILTKRSNSKEELHNTPQHNASGYIRHKVYERTLAWRAGDKLQGVKRELTALGLAPKGPLADNDFSWLANAIFRQVKGDDKSVTNLIRTISRDLAFAEHCGVPPKYLVGFIHQIGGSKRIEQLSAAAKKSARDRDRGKSDGSVSITTSRSGSKGHGRRSVESAKRCSNRPGRATRKIKSKAKVKPKSGR